MFTGGPPIGEFGRHFFVEHDLNSLWRGPGLGCQDALVQAKFFVVIEDASPHNREIFIGFEDVFSTGCILHVVDSAPGQVFSKEQLLDQLYSIDDIPSENVIEAYVRRLRKLVGPDTIKTRRGQGYLFDADSR